MLNGKAYFHRYKSKAIITISTQVWQDSAWPFEDGENLEAKINDGDVIISKRLKGQKKLDDS